MSSSKNFVYEKNSFLNKSNNEFIDHMYLRFINNDAGLPESWKNYFTEIGEELNVVVKEINGPSWSPAKKKIDINEIQTRIEKNEQNLSREKTEANLDQKILSKTNSESIKAVALIRAYRQRGHLIAKLDPLEMMKKQNLY